MWEKLFRCLVGVRRVCRSFHILLAVIKPEIPVFPSSLTSSPATLSIPERLMYASLVFYIVCTWWAHISLVAILILTFGFATLDAMENMK